MTAQVLTVLEQARKLTHDEQLELVRELLAEVESAETPEWAAAWKSELERRWAAWESGDDAGMPFDDAVEDIRLGLPGARP